MVEPILLGDQRVGLDVVGQPGSETAGRRDEAENVLGAQFLDPFLDGIIIAGESIPFNFLLNYNGLQVGAFNRFEAGLLVDPGPQDILPGRALLREGQEGHG